MAKALTFSGKSSQLTVDYFPAIDLSDGDYVCGLVDFQTFNSIPNIDKTNNLFYVGYENFFNDELLVNEVGENESIEVESLYDDGDNNLNSNDVNAPQYVVVSEQQQQQSETIATTTKTIKNSKIKKRQPLTSIQIPTGSYEVEDLYKYLKKVLKIRNVELLLRANKNTLQCEIMCSQPIDFTKPNNIGSLLGFRHEQILEENIVHVSKLPADILKVNVIRVECSIIQGSYLNGQPSHSIHEFSPQVPPGYKIVEVPQHVIYFPVTVKNIHSISLSIVDQQNQLVDFRGETITVRLHIKKVT